MFNIDISVIKDKIKDFLLNKISDKLKLHKIIFPNCIPTCDYNADIDCNKCCCFCTSKKDHLY